MPGKRRLSLAQRCPQGYQDLGMGFTDVGKFRGDPIFASNRTAWAALVGTTRLNCRTADSDCNVSGGGGHQKERELYVATTRAKGNVRLYH